MVAPVTGIVKAGSLPHVKNDGDKRIQIKTSYYTAKVYDHCMVHLEVPGESEGMREARRCYYGGAEGPWSAIKRNGYQIRTDFPNEFHAVFSENARINNSLPPPPPHPVYGYRTTDFEGNPLPVSEEAATYVYRLHQHHFGPRHPLNGLQDGPAQAKAQVSNKFEDKYPKTAFAVNLIAVGALGLYIYYNLGNSIVIAKNFWNGKYSLPR